MANRSLVWIGILVVVAALAGVPFVVSNYVTTFLLLSFMYIGLASSWNIISGYTGYISFGHAAFFGVGAYTAALLILRGGVHWVLASLVGGLVALLIALPLGYTLLRLRGPYFAISMLGLAAAFEVIANIWEPVTRGGAGLNLPPNANLTQNYYAMLVVMLAVIGLSYRIITTKHGWRLIAIREDEAAAGVMGINTTLYKVAAYAISAFFPGVFGGLYAWQLAYIDPNSVFRAILSVGMVIMTMFGGVGTVVGPIIGGILLSILSELFWARLPEFHQAAYGTLIILIVLVMPGGIMSLLKSRGLLPANWRG